MGRHNGQIIGAKPYMGNVNWTKGIDEVSPNFGDGRDQAAAA